MPKTMKQPHILFISYPAQGHINPMISLAKILHFEGCLVTFVLTNEEYERIRQFNSGCLSLYPGFNFKNIPLQDLPLCESQYSKDELEPFYNLVLEVNNGANGISPVTCIISDGMMSFTLDVAAKLNIPGVLFCSMSACGFLAYSCFETLIHKNFIPLRDYGQLTDVPLEDIVLDCAPSMHGVCLKDMPSYVRTYDPEDKDVAFIVSEIKAAQKASAIICNTFEDLESDVLQKLTSTFTPPIYPIGPLSELANQIAGNTAMQGFKSSLWNENNECLDWLRSKEDNSVVYVSFGSLAKISTPQLDELVCGLVNSKQNILFVTRDNMIDQNRYQPYIPRDKWFWVNWCDQETVLNHPAIGAFLTHSGWNSTLDSISNGVPMLCMPRFAEQFTNCWYSCNKWGIGIEIDGLVVNRNQVEKVVKDLMVGEKGKEMRTQCKIWKEKANNSTSSQANLDSFIKKVILG